MNSERTQDQILRDFLRLLRRQRWLILAFVAVAAAAGIAYSVLKTPVYKASAQLEFLSEQQSLALSLAGTQLFPSQTPEVQVAAQARVITSPGVIKRVSKSPGVNLSQAEVRDSVSSGVDPNTDLVTLTTSAKDADLAARLANDFARQTKIVASRQDRSFFRRAADRVRHAIDTSKGKLTRQERRQEQAIRQDSLSRLQQLSGLANPVTIVSPATTPSSASSPKPILDTLLAAVFGGILGILAAFLRDSLDRRLTDAREVQHQLEFPTVGFVDAEALGRIGTSRNGAQPDVDRSLEQFRILRSNVDFIAPEKPIRTIAVTSAVAEEGKSTVAAGLATANALAGRRVLLVDCDLRRPILAQRFNVQPQPGLTDWLTERADPRNVVQAAQLYSPRGQDQNGIDAADSTGAMLTVVPAGNLSAQPTELLALPRFREFLEQVVEVYDIVILDCAPLLPVGDTLQVLPLADAALLCVRLNRTTRDQALAAKSAIEHFPPRPTGVVVTGVRPGGEGYYYGYYSYTARQSQLVVAPLDRR